MGTKDFSVLNNYDGTIPEYKSFITILNPANSPGYYIGPISKFPLETEVLNGPNEKFQILGSDYKVSLHDGKKRGFLLIYHYLEE